MKLKVKNTLTLLAACMIFASCATAYKPLGPKIPLVKPFGYSDEQIDENHFTVNFIGNGVTSKKMVVQYAMRRAAEVSLDHGFQYFKVLSIKDDSQNSTVPVTQTGQTLTAQYPAVSLHILGLHTPVSADCFNASEVLN